MIARKAAVTFLVFLAAVAAASATDERDGGARTSAASIP